MTTTLEPDTIDRIADRSGFDKIHLLLGQFANWVKRRQELVEVSYLIPERSGFGWYVVTKNPVFDFELNKQLSDFAAALIRHGYAIHAALVPGSDLASVPTDAIAITSLGQVATHAN